MIQWQPENIFGIKLQPIRTDFWRKKSDQTFSRGDLTGRLLIRLSTVLKLATCSDQLRLASNTFPWRFESAPRSFSLVLYMLLLSLLFAILCLPWYVGLPSCFMTGFCFTPAAGVSTPITAAVAIQLIHCRVLLMELIGGDYPNLRPPGGQRSTYVRQLII